VLVPDHITNKQELLNLLATRLHFPAYFGFNWDAFDECLSDLSWLQESDVCLWHKDIPLASTPEEARRYIHVLMGILREPSNVSLWISFPEVVREEIHALLAQ
jgi:RNAse (barnase) inhibitor barstar